MFAPERNIRQSRMASHLDQHFLKCSLELTALVVEHPRTHVRCRHDLGKTDVAERPQNGEAFRHVRRAVVDAGNPVAMQVDVPAHLAIIALREGPSVC